MGNDVFAGIEFGEMEIRAAYARDRAPSVLQPDGKGAAEPLVQFDPARNISSLGVGFPGVLQNIGTGTSFTYAGRTLTADTIVQRRLASIREQITREAGLRPTITAIAVPTALSQRKRQALLDCAKQAGLDQVTLIDRAIAVAFGIRSRPDESGTHIVFSLDYGACEYSLARIARGRCWILGSAFAPQISGERLDALIMEDIILALRDRQLFLGLKSFTPGEWLNFRQMAESIRLKLDQPAVVDMALNQELTDTATRVTAQISAGRFAHSVSRTLAETIEGMNALLENNGLERSNLDSVVLVGEVATTPPVANIIADAFPGRVIRSEVDIVALGAVLCAANGTGAVLPPVERPLAGSSGELRSLSSVFGLPGDDRRPDGVSAQFTRVVNAARANTPPAAPAPRGRQRSLREDRIDRVRRLQARGRKREAEQLLVEVLKEIDELREQLAAVVPTGPQQLIHQAQALIVDGSYQEAVNLAHEAYRKAPHDPAVFTGMMKIHADAGLGLHRPEQYEDAVRILSCAYGHDQTDRAIHRALAERHYMHSVAMKRLNNLTLARDAAQRALEFDPRHQLASQMLSELESADEKSVEA